MTWINLRLENREQTALITIARPKVLNALNRATLLELEAAFLHLAQDKTVRTAILTGEGEKSFVAGADIAELAELSPRGAKEHAELGHRVFDRIAELPFPVVAAVNGFALGGGLELALACDFIYASKNAQLGLVETSLGLIPGFGGIARLVRRVGEARARELIYSGRRIFAEEAAAIGLVSQVTSPEGLLKTAFAFAENIRRRGPLAVSAAKGLINRVMDASLSTANWAEQREFGLIVSTKDVREGVSAFLTKREPCFLGE